MRNIRLQLAYDGTDYCGWQRQTNGTSIQEAVETAIERITRAHSDVIGAGRTDAGVHAAGQVAHFYTESQIPCYKIRTGMQNFLPKDIVVVSAEDVPPQFHARYNAQRKRYRYLIDNSEAPLPFLRRFTHHVRDRLDVEAMHAAAQELVGRHDFRSFESHWPNKADSIRTIEALTIRRTAGWPIWYDQSWKSEASAGGPFICLDIVADGFLYNMVRSITGTLLEAGRGKLTRDDVRHILVGQDRSRAGMTAPASGLCLVEVDYGPTAPSQNHES
ncbi:MAG TPA: tRNA pseudouridine(38-40) synthase TruA [Planctomycetaceae bacterium]|nr:tRNA pseudouridine(38-40) synthase TruA [Planctomycetaceae bacterium]